jgi:hypothetical protein
MQKALNFKSLFVLLAISAFTGNNKIWAQLSAIHDFSRCDSVLLISENNDTLLYPFAGGMNSCQFANIDINLDGIDDLLVFDRHGFRILPFLVSASSPVQLHFAPELASLFPPLEQWMQAIDYNNDGKKDIFTYTTAGIKVYRNDSQTTLKFKQVTHPFLLSLQGTTLTNILVTWADYPAIADVDADGDMDVLTFWGGGSFVEWHKNTSMERFGNADSLTFEKASSCWGHFAEGGEGNTITLDTCAGTDKLIRTIQNSADDDPKHTGSTLLVNDLNGDGLPDITIGDVDFSPLVHLTNGGTLAEANIISQTTDFPNASDPVNLEVFPAAMLADVNNDGKKDLLISPFDPSLTQANNFKSSGLYLNNGTNLQPDYNLVTKSFLQEQMLDLGSGAYPVLFDYNADGLMDLLVGNYGYQDTCIFSPDLQCSFTAKIALLINTGTLAKPVFRLADRNVAKLDTLQMQSLILALADMDGDGDDDLVCGNSKGRLVYCENIALPGQPAEFKLIDPAWLGIDVGDFAAPQLLDMDGDGLTDLVCGKKNGTLSYYKNTGTAQVPTFNLVSEIFGGVDVTNTDLSYFGYAVPCFYKDKQGETVLFSGSEFGDIFVFDQISNNLEGNFRFLGTVPGIKEGWRSGVTLGNLNNDTLSDMLVSNYAGGLGLFYGKPDKIFGVKEQPYNSFSSLSITPNPAGNEVTIDMKSDLPVKSATLLIQGMEGGIIRQYSRFDFPVQINVSEFRNGIYLLTILTNKGLVTGKLVICR